jgi:ATP-dependent Lhr-like helicase
MRRWVWHQNWENLRDVQERAVEPIMAGRDVVLASATASGKTEAAFLPLLSRQAPEDGLQILAVSPLKALINDQSRRLESLAEAVAMPVTPWHGDVPQSVKRRLVARPAGILLITPESLEAMLVTRGSSAAAFFGNLDYVVVDELHSFIATERGRQLQSLLHRVELITRRSVPRVGLSATLGDLEQAARFLRPDGASPEIVESTVTRRDVQIQLRGYCADEAGCADHLYGVVARGTHIAFANRRAVVEERVQDLKTRAGDAGRVTDAFWAHHGSLAKELREDAERALRNDGDAVVVATTTLELGIDVGGVDTIVQLGVPPSVASMRQRLGRSGRRDGDRSILRIYAEEDRLDVRAPPQDQLRAGVVQSTAMVQLLAEGYNETAWHGALHLSTLVQQVLSLVAQHGGLRADDGWRALCATGPFRAVSSAQFARLLRDLAEGDLLQQTHDGTIVFGPEGERVVNHYDFYTAFVTSDEYRLVAETQTLGTLPVTRPVAIGDHMLFAGRRWRVIAVRSRDRVIELVPAPGGTAPHFGGGGPLVDDVVRTRMRQLYEAEEVPAFLDAGARELLAEGRRSYRRLELPRSPVMAWGDDTVAFPWVGDRALNTLGLMLAGRGLRAASDGVALLIRDAEPQTTVDAMRMLIRTPPGPGALVAQVQNKHTEKHHWRLGPELLDADYASSNLDIAGAVRAAAALAGT